MISFLTLSFITPNSKAIIKYKKNLLIIEDELMIHQKVIISNNRSYLIRVFVNDKKQPPVAVTVYKTSKIDKYLKL